MYKNFKLTEEEKNQILEMHQSNGYKKPLNEQEISGANIDDVKKYFENSDNFVISDEITSSSQYTDIFIIKVLDKNDEKQYTVFLKRLQSGKKRVKLIENDNRHIEDMVKYSKIEKFVLSTLEKIDLPKRFSFNIKNGKTKPLF